MNKSIFEIRVVYNDEKISVKIILESSVKGFYKLWKSYNLC